MTDLLEVDVHDLDAQMPDLLAELLSGAGAIVIRQAFPADEIAEARRLIHHYSEVKGTRRPTSRAPTPTPSTCSGGFGICSTRARSSNGWSSTPR